MTSADVKKFREQITGVTELDELRDIAIRVIEKLKQPVGMVCGPLTNGGLGSFERNLTLMKIAIQKLQARGLSIFDQTPFQEPMIRMIREGRATEDDFLQKFYLPLFELKLIRTLHFLPQWESSYGARWEHAQAPRFNLALEHLEKKDIFL